MAFELEVKQGPVVTVGAQIDMSAPSAVSAVRASARDVLLSPEMGRACPSFSRAAINFYIVYEIRFGHRTCSGWLLHHETIRFLAIRYFFYHFDDAVENIFD